MVVRFYNGIIAIVVTTIAVFCALVLLNTYNTGKSVAQDMASDTFLSAIYNVEEKLEATFSQARKVSTFAALSDEVLEPLVLDGLSHESLDLFIPALLQYPSVYAIYFGHSNGDFLQVIATRGIRAIIERHGAPANTAFIVRAIIKEGDGERYVRWSFLDRFRNKIGGKETEVGTYDPRQRPWYKPALRVRGSYLTEPYRFDSLQKTGITISRKLNGNHGVLGVDLLFSDLSGFLLDQQLSKNGRLLLFDGTDKLVASSGNELVRLADKNNGVLDLKASQDPMIKSVLQLNEQELYNRNHFIEVNGEDHLFHLSEIGLSATQHLYIAAYGPFSDFSAHIIRLQQSVLMSVVFVIVLIVPGVYFVTRRLSRDLERLENEAVSVQQLKFDKQPVIRSFVKEIDQLGSAFGLMKKTIRRRTRDLQRTHQQLEYLVDRSISISAEKDEEKLYQIVLSAAKDLSESERAILILASEESLTCRMIMCGDKVLTIDAKNGEGAIPSSLASLSEDVCAELALLEGLASYSDTHSDRNHLIFTVMEALDPWAENKVSSILRAPLVPMHGGSVGVMILGKETKVDEDSREFQSETWGFVQSFAAQVANVEELRRRETQLEAIVQSRTESLAEKEAQLRLALDNMPGGMFMIDHSQRIIVANEKYQALFDLPDGLLDKGKPLVDLIHYLSRRGDEGEVTTPEDVRTMATRFVQGQPLSFERKLAFGRFVGVNVSPTPDGGAVVVATDITDSRVALQLLQESEEKARSIIHNAADGIVVVDQQGLIQLFSPSAESIFGYQSDEVIGKSIEPLIPKSLKEKHQGFMRDYLLPSNSEERGQLREAVGCRKNGEQFPMDLAVGEATVGAQTLFTGIVKDISARKEAERRLLDAYGIIQASINYASRIQRSVLPDEQLISEYLPEHLIIWEPRDVVGGDFYWAAPWGNGFLMVLGDCTGHGVPGAFMTLIFSAVLDRVTEETSPGEVGQLITHMHQLIQRMLGQQNEADALSHDGIELGAFYFVPGSDVGTFVGARFDLYVVNGEHVNIIKGTKKGIGYGNIPAEQEYKERSVALSLNESFYMATDGIIDQIGGPKDRAFGKRRFVKLLQSIQHAGMDDQKRIILEEFALFQGASIRRDDVALIGFTVPRY